VKPQIDIAETLQPDDAEAEVLAALMRPMLKKRLFVVLSVVGKYPELIRRHLVEHLHYVIELEKADVLFASGPFSAGEDGRLGDGLTILRAENVEAARAIAEQDPFVRHGVRTFTIREWTVNEGSVSMKVHLSDQSVSLA